MVEAGRGRTRFLALWGLMNERLQHALVTEYSPGAAIGWHKDRPEFNDVIGISAAEIEN
jgi:alkylated DNA repair dioxygenase AlkB